MFGPERRRYRWYRSGGKRGRSKCETPLENVKVEIEEKTEDLVVHKIDLAVSCEAEFEILEKQYTSPIEVLYYYNVATVPLAMSAADQKMYPEVYKAFEAAKGDDGKLQCKIEFNAPCEQWDLSGAPEKGGKRHRNGVRVKLATNCMSDFLERLHDGHRFNISVEINGYLYRHGYRGSRFIPLTLKKDPIALKVDQSGETRQEFVDMCPGLFGRFELNGEFTIALKWCGPEQSYNTLKWLKTVAEEAPKDVSIVLEDGKAYKCHSYLIRACSPLLTSMLICNRFDPETTVIELKDVDANTLEAFLNFVNHKAVDGAVESSEICFKLFVLSRKYDVFELQKVTKTLLEVQPMEWLQTSTALELVCFLRYLSDEEGLYERAKSVLISRNKAEIQELKRFKELLQEDPYLAKAIINLQAGEDAIKNILLKLDGFNI